jgi:hypothetical protein
MYPFPIPGLVLPVVSQRELASAFRIRVGRSTLTATVINLKQGRFLVTARHGVETFSQGHPVELFWNGAWKEVHVEPVADPMVDFSYDVVAARISDSVADQPFTELLNRTDFFVSQEMYFLGFPLSLATDVPDGYEIPIPLVKKGLFSGIQGAGPFQVMFLDAMNTKGFSGGPVFANDPRAQGLALAAIVGRYHHRTVKLGVRVEDATGVAAATKGTVTIEENVGITYAYTIVLQL